MVNEQLSVEIEGASVVAHEFEGVGRSDWDFEKGGPPDGEVVRIYSFERRLTSPIILDAYIVVDYRVSNEVFVVVVLCE